MTAIKWQFHFEKDGKEIGERPVKCCFWERQLLLSNEEQQSHLPTNTQTTHKHVYDIFFFSHIFDVSQIRVAVIRSCRDYQVVRGVGEIGGAVVVVGGVGSRRGGKKGEPLSWYLRAGTFHQNNRKKRKASVGLRCFCKQFGRVVMCYSQVTWEITGGGRENRCCRVGERERERGKMGEDGKDGRSQEGVGKKKGRKKRPRWVRWVRDRERQRGIGQ